MHKPTTSTDPLVIEYVFEGHQRGYNLTSPTRHLGEATVKTIWRNAMPRGQGWGAYIGARSLKAFPLDDGRIALSEVTVTDLQDEGGRRGIRRAVIHTLSQDDALAHLRDRLASYPPETLARIEKKPSLGQWKHIVDETLPKLRRDGQIVLSRPYTTDEDWQSVEAFILKLVMARLNPLRRWGKLPPFTTLALDSRDESPLVAIPTQQRRPADGITEINLRW